MINRISTAKTLAELLPSGVEGGKEFARIVDLLLFHDARRRGESVLILNDDAGDYAALDSVGRSLLIGDTGFQYKFYKSPFTSKHRTAIKAALNSAIAKKKTSNITRWVLITPENLVEAPAKRKGGDVTWFNELQRLSAKRGLVIDHWGHKQLQALFIETPSLALFYYPSLVPNASERRTALQDVLSRYVANLFTAYSKIQFVGMSVYKPEATKGIALDDIYIPLRVVAEGADDDSDATAYLDPVTMLAPGACHVVLGDPGSGKSTLLRFLALCGKSAPLQRKFNADADPERIPILVTLRRYADELKSRPLLSLFDYIVEMTHADFSLKDADANFFAAFLDAGRAVLCFDGLDELPNQYFKETVRNRIIGLLDSYPGNTCFVTSRIVGYDSSFRFDDRRFKHHRVGRLRLPEIEQFVADWYAVREESTKSREDNVTALVRVIRDPEHDAIRELAKNPLLLTIIALVHRIDAVLPDERVVLYTKCTETLLNTWHTWKFRDMNETVSRGKVERRNKLRIEAIAHWMQTLSVAAAPAQRAVVSHDDTELFLADYITNVERAAGGENDSRALAVNFLEFVRQRAGLLIEVGDKRYSFVHLTFQEYLAASYLLTASEMGGAERLWQSIKANTAVDRWQETIRLLIALLKSTDTRGFIVDAIIRQGVKSASTGRAMLLLGCVLDGIDEAEERAADILRLAIAAMVGSDDVDDIARTIARTRLAAGRCPSGASEAVGLDVLCSRFDTTASTATALVAAAAGVATPDWVATRPQYSPWLRMVLPQAHGDRSERIRSEDTSILFDDIRAMLQTSREHNLIGSVVLALLLGVDFETASRMTAPIVLLNTMLPFSGPFHHGNFHLARFVLPHILGCSAPRIERTRRELLDAKMRTIIEDAVARTPRRADEATLRPPTALPILRAPRLTSRRVNPGLGDPDWPSLFADAALSREIVGWLVSRTNLAPSAHWRAGLLQSLPSLDLGEFFSTVRTQLETPAARATLLLNSEVRLFFVLLDAWCRYYAPHSVMARRLTELADQAEKGPWTAELRLGLALRAALTRESGALEQLTEALTAPQLATTFVRMPRRREVDRPLDDETTVG